MSLRLPRDQIALEMFDPAEHAASMAYIELHGHDERFDTTGCAICHPAAENSIRSIMGAMTRGGVLMGRAA